MQNYEKKRLNAIKSNAKTYRKKEKYAKFYKSRQNYFNVCQKETKNVQNYATEKLMIKSNYIVRGS